MDSNSPQPADQQPKQEVNPGVITPTPANPLPSEQVSPEVMPPQENLPIDQKKPRSKNLVAILRFLVVGGGLFIVFIIGLGISFSACFTIKGPPPPQCGPVSLVSLVLMPGASLLFLIPIARKIK